MLRTCDGGGPLPRGVEPHLRTAVSPRGFTPRLTRRGGGGRSPGPRVAASLTNGRGRPGITPGQPKEVGVCPHLPGPAGPRPRPLPQPPGAQVTFPWTQTHGQGAERSPRAMHGSFWKAWTWTASAHPVCSSARSPRPTPNASLLCVSRPPRVPHGCPSLEGLGGHRVASSHERPHSLPRPCHAPARPPDAA